MKRESSQKHSTIPPENEKTKVKPKSSKKAIFNRLIATQTDTKVLMNSNMFHFPEAKNCSPTSLMSSPKGTPRNQTTLNKFTREVSLFCFELDHDSTGFLNYMKFCSLLNKLRFIEDPFNKSDQERELILKAWKIIGGNQERKSKIDTIYSFLLGVMGLSTKNDFLTSTKKKCKSAKLIGLSSKAKKLNLHLEFFLLYQNRTCEKKKQPIHIEISDITPLTGETLENKGSTSMIKSETQEQQDVIDLESNFPRESFNRQRLVRRVSLRDMVNPNQLSPKQPTNPSHILHISDTPKNLSLNNSDSEEATKINQVLTPPANFELNSSFFNRLKVQVVSSKNNESFRKDLNQSVTYKISTKKMDDSVAYNTRESFKIQMHTVESRENSVILTGLEKDELLDLNSGRKSGLGLTKQKTVNEVIKPPRTPMSKTSNFFFN